MNVCVLLIALAGFLAPTVVPRSPAAAAAHTQAATREKAVIEIQIGVKDKTAMRMMVREGDMGTVTIDDFGRFGFKPVLRDDAATAVRVDIFDAAAAEPKLLGTADVSVGAAAVQSKTTPSFALRIPHVTQPPRQ
jgi:hypothetical protein